MTKNRTCLAMLLAGGEGRRLSPLTSNMAKPAVPFGGRCRIIDYTLSNCVNSGIGTIGVLTQYEASSLHRHIGDGTAWQMRDSEAAADITLLPSSRISSEGYAGTADAIYQNMDYIEWHGPEHVLILSGDHIYRMDYDELLRTHIASGAAATVAVKRVPWKDASRFGIMNTDESNRIVDFVEKPGRPESNLASMGIYMFRWANLREVLLEDRNDDASSRDFGKDIIPRLLRSGMTLQAHPFDGYWRDVGTVESLWEAHMDIIDGEAHDEEVWPIQTRRWTSSFKSYVSPQVDVRNSYIHSGSTVEGNVNRSFIFGDVAIGSGADIRESIIMPNARIGRNASLSRVILGEGAYVEDGAVIGSPNGDVTVIGAGERVAAVQSNFRFAPFQLPDHSHQHPYAQRASSLAGEIVGVEN
ncbi:Glucose-1-phosphate adenylyltransferase [Paenibacillus plantiphilus]|uniref:Glucose-1-phosphate adenylyltransferase n=1 Tax=Paenibacillus plantiphilus TaxID=2905650 RepID=A0ABM9BSA7_9BACL|nr:sugar phosphate nucleotidyltransferase [Paenibacillus plantiphilus]CAH1193707.1 Glucose-1-phosphate adenylyltransferase [Paenibacillus plantiphilus]